MILGYEHNYIADSEVLWRSQDEQETRRRRRNGKWKFGTAAPETRREQSTRDAARAQARRRGGIEHKTIIPGRPRVRHGNCQSTKTKTYQIMTAMTKGEEIVRIESDLGNCRGNLREHLIQFLDNFLYGRPVLRLRAPAIPDEGPQIVGIERFRSDRSLSVQNGLSQFQTLV